MDTVRALKGFSFVSALVWIGISLLLAVSLPYYVERQIFRETSLLISRSPKDELSGKCLLAYHPEWSSRF